MQVTSPAVTERIYRCTCTRTKGKGLKDSLRLVRQDGSEMQMQQTSHDMGATPQPAKGSGSHEGCDRLDIRQVGDDGRWATAGQWTHQIVTMGHGRIMDSSDSRVRREAVAAPRMPSSKSRLRTRCLGPQRPWTFLMIHHLQELFPR